MFEVNYFDYFRKLKKSDVFKKDTREVYDNYVVWANKNKITPLPIQTFSTVISKAFDVKSKPYVVEYEFYKQKNGRRFE